MLSRLSSLSLRLLIIQRQQELRSSAAGVLKKKKKKEEEEKKKKKKKEEERRRWRTFSCSKPGTTSVQKIQDPGVSIRFLDPYNDAFERGICGEERSGNALASQ